MFRVELSIPVKWVTKDSEIHFKWNGSCEASLFNPITGRHLYGLSNDCRDTYKIKKGQVKNDLNDQNLVLSKSDTHIQICYLLEMACQEMLGTQLSWGGE